MRKPVECRRVVLLVVLSSILVTGSAAAALTIAVDATRVVVSGVAAKGSVVLFGRSLVNEAGVPRLARHSRVERDDDGDGAIVFPFEEIPLLSTWVAVDYEEGTFVVGSRPGFAPRTLTFAPAQWKETAATVDLSRAYLDFLLVRPRKGAWALSIHQGSARDDDGKVDATLRARIAAFRPLIGKEAPPPHATKKDVLAIIDGSELDVVVVAAQ